MMASAVTTCDLKENIDSVWHLQLSTLQLPHHAYNGKGVFISYDLGGWKISSNNTLKTIPPTATP